MALSKSPLGAKSLCQYEDVKDQKNHYNSAFTYLLSAFADAYDKEGEFYNENYIERPKFMPQPPLGNCLTDVERLQQQNLSDLTSLLGNFDSNGEEASSLIRELVLEKMDKFVELEQWRFTQSAQLVALNPSETDLPSRKDHLKGILESYGELALWRDDLKQRTAHHNPEIASPGSVYDKVSDWSAITRAGGQKGRKDRFPRIKSRSHTCSPVSSPGENVTRNNKQLNSRTKKPKKALEGFYGDGQRIPDSNCRRRLDLTVGHNGSVSVLVETREGLDEFEAPNRLAVVHDNQKTGQEGFKTFLNGDLTEMCRTVWREGIGYCKVAISLAAVVFVSRFLDACLFTRRDGKGKPIAHRSKSSRPRKIHLPDLQVTEVSSVATVMVPRLPKGPPLG